MRLVIATGNAHKVGELRALLPGLTLVGLDAFPPFVAPVEDAPDYEGNAALKALAAHAHTGEPCLADDSGLEVEALGWGPGIHSARYAPGSDADRRRALLQAVRATGAPGSTASALLPSGGLPGATPAVGWPSGGYRARFVCAIAVAGLPGVVGCRLFRGVCEGRIVEAERGLGGFGYDPLFEVPAFGRTFAELTAVEKHALSHRGRAAQAALPVLREFLARQP